jgi:hypothetical protein
LLMPAVLPPLKTTTQSIYRLEFDADGFPCRPDGDGVLRANPIFGKYAIQDFLLQADQTGDRRFLDAAAHVGRAAIGRMERLGDALVFWYGDETKPARNRGRHYSGLTQSHYAVLFQRLADRSGDRGFAAAAADVFTSLCIPAEDGGVAYRRPWGTIIAETPLEPNDVILNGWLTAMLNVWEYASLSGSSRAFDLFSENLTGLRHALDLFDVPRLCNSRYGSAGFAYFRVLFPALGRRKSPYCVSNIRLHVPDEGSYAITRHEGTRWEAYSFAADVADPAEVVRQLTGRALRLNLVLNYLPYPRENTLKLSALADSEGHAMLQMLRADYNPRAAAANREPVWADVGATQVQLGENELEWAIDWRVADLVAYPTSFLKKVGDRFFNVYHFLHIDQLRRLHAITGEAFLQTYAERWTSYVEEWPRMQEYSDVETTPSPHRGHPYS